jgi:hypothetical protein
MPTVALLVRRSAKLGKLGDRRDVLQFLSLGSWGGWPTLRRQPIQKQVRVAHPLLLAKGGRHDSNCRDLFHLSFSLTLLFRSLIKDNQPITMLAISNKPFAFKILPVTLYSPKILTGFTAQIFDSTRPEGGGGYPPRAPN